MKVLVDKNVNLKKIKELVALNPELNIIELDIENNCKSTQKVGGLFILRGYGKLGSSRLAGPVEGSNYEKLRAIIGKDKIGDILHIESALHENVDFLVTEDGDILDRRDELTSKFPNLKILKLFNFEKEIQNA